MPPEQYISNDANEIIAIKKPQKDWIFRLRFLLIGYLIIFFKDYETTKNEPWAWGFLALIVMANIIILFEEKSKKIQFIINEKGLWTPKNGFVPWEDIWYYSIKEWPAIREYPPNYQLSFKLKEKDKIITIKFETINFKIENIQKSLRIYSQKFNVHDLGYEIES